MAGEGDHGAHGHLRLQPQQLGRSSGVCIDVYFFFFQAEDGIRDYKVTGVQTCALPIYRNQYFSGKIAYHLDTRNELGVTVFQSDGHTHLDNDPTIDGVNHQTLSAFSVYSSNEITSAWKSLLRAGQGQDKSTTTGVLPSVFATRQPQYTWQNDIKLGPGTAIAGAEYLIQDVTSDSTFAQNQRTIKSAFAGYLGAFGKHDLQANVRVDDNSQFGSHTTGLLGYAYRLTGELRFRVGAGTAFKAPTFNDLYAIDPTGSFTPNPNLRPESSQIGRAHV